MLTTMCGHGMISSSLAKKNDRLGQKGGHREQAVTYMARFCSARL